MLLEEVEKFSLPIGKQVKVKVKSGSGKERKEFAGTVIACNNRHFSVQGERYKESFLKAAVYLGEIGVEQAQQQERGSLRN